MKPRELANLGVPRGEAMRVAAQADLVEPVAWFNPRLVKMAEGGERPED